MTPTSWNIAMLNAIAIEAPARYFDSRSIKRAKQESSLMFGLGATEILVLLAVLAFGCGGMGLVVLLIVLYLVKQNRGEKRD